MCRRSVIVDARGRCPLGHQVVPVHVVEQRREERGQAREATLEDAAARAAEPDGDRMLIATYIEPRTTDPTPPPPAAGQRPDARPAFDDPPPPLPSAAGDAQPAAAPPPALPVRPRGTAGAEPVRSLFSRDTTTPATSPAPTSVLADGSDGSERSPGGRVVVPLTDLTPDAPSALDLYEAPPSESVPDPADEAVFEQVPLTDPGLEPPRGVLQMIAGGVFVAILLAVAWYLATTL